MGRFLAGAFCAAALLTASSVAYATTTTRSYEVKGFFVPWQSAPWDPVTLDFTLTFDPTQDYGPATSGLVVTNFTLPYASEWAYSASYFGPGQSLLTLGTDVISTGSATLPDGSYFLDIWGPETSEPYTTAYSFGYDASEIEYASPSTRITFTEAALTVTAVPEPATLALFGAGLVGARVMRRRWKV